MVPVADAGGLEIGAIAVGDDPADHRATARFVHATQFFVFITAAERTARQIG